MRASSALISVPLSASLHEADDLRLHAAGTPALLRLAERGAAAPGHLVAIVHPDGGPRLSAGDSSTGLRSTSGDRRGGGVHGAASAVNSAARMVSRRSLTALPSTPAIELAFELVELDRGLHRSSRALQHQGRAGRLLVEVALADVDRRLERDRARLVAVVDGDDVCRRCCRSP
jgi:hypothetical protein